MRMERHSEASAAPVLASFAARAVPFLEMEHFSGASFCHSAANRSDFATTWNAFKGRKKLLRRSMARIPRNPWMLHAISYIGDRFFKLLKKSYYSHLLRFTPLLRLLLPPRRRFFSFCLRIASVRAPWRRKKMASAISLCRVALFPSFSLSLSQPRALSLSLSLSLSIYLCLSLSISVTRDPP